MIKNNKQLVIAIVAAVAIGIAGGSYWWTNRTVSTVGEYKITAKDVKRDIKTYTGKVTDNYTEYSEEEKAELIAKHKEKALTDMENEKIMETKAIELGLIPSASELDNWVQQNFDAKKAQYESEEEFQSYVKQNFYTEDEFKSAIRKQMIRTVLFNHLYSDITVTEEEAKKYFEDHKEELTIYPYASVTTVTSDSKEKLEAVISAYHESLDMKAASESVGDSVKYEYVGKILLEDEKSEYSKEIRDMLKKLSYSDVSEIVELDGKFVVFQADDVQTETVVPKYKDYKDAMKASVESQKQKTILEDALAQWRAEIMQ